MQWSKNAIGKNAMKQKCNRQNTKMQCGKNAKMQ